MIEALRNQFEKEDTETLVVAGMALSVTGSAVWVSASDEEISSILGIGITTLGVAVLLATVVWGTSEKVWPTIRYPRASEIDATKNGCENTSLTLS